VKMEKLAENGQMVQNCYPLSPGARHDAGAWAMHSCRTYDELGGLRGQFTQLHGACGDGEGSRSVSGSIDEKCIRVWFPYDPAASLKTRWF